MLTRKDRHISRKEFALILKRGSSWRLSPFTIRALSRGDKYPSRFGFVVSTKVSKKAVTRNRIRRRLQAIIRENRPNINLGLDVVILTNPQVLLSSYEDMRSIFTTVLRESGIMNIEKNEK